ncbi:MAG: hypothetical protein M4D80_16430 [Myxococcota bacterium]|nr:hypothetical protein [Myxococcota bacterium]
MRCLVLVLLALGGCSAALVEGPQPPRCTTTYAAPIIDTVIATAAVSALVLVSTGTSRGDGGDGEVAQTMIGVPAGITMFAYGASAAHGYTTVRGCRTFKAR